MSMGLRTMQRAHLSLQVQRKPHEKRKLMAKKLRTKSCDIPLTPGSKAGWPHREVGRGRRGAVLAPTTLLSCSSKSFFYFPRK